MDQPDPTHLAFDDVVIDFAGHRLLRGGQPQPLEPKAFGVLALLAQAPGTVFARDDILDAVWGHRHVTPGVLNRVMTLLRHALGEDAQAARYLHTVHGVGYRFDLPAGEFPPSPFVGPAAGTEAGTGAGTVIANTIADGSRTDDVPPRLAVDAAGLRESRISPRWHAWLVPALVVLLAAAWQFWPRPQPVGSAPARTASAPQEIPSLVVMPLKPIGSGEGVRTIADGLSEELIGSLARIEGLRVIARESTRLAAAETRDPALLAQRLGITHALEGSLQQSGQALRIRLRLLDAGGGALWSKDFDRNASEVLLMQREIAESVAASLTLKLGLTDVPLESGDAEFLRRLLAARALAANRDLPPEESIQAAIPMLRALLQERPEDARAHAELASALNSYSIRQPNLPDAARFRVEAEQVATFAQRLDPSLPGPPFVLAVAACARNEWEKCFMHVRAADARGADMPPAFSTTMLMARLGYLDQAEAMAREQLARDPLNGTYKFTHGRILDTLGRHDEARRLLFDADTERSLSPGYGRWFNAYWRDDRAEALRIATREVGNGDGRSGALLKPGYVAASRAMADPALWSQVPAATEAFERETGLLNFVRLLAPDAPQYSAEFIHRLGEARAKGYSTWDLLLWTRDLAYLRRDPAFQAYLRDSGILAYWRKHGFPNQCRPQADGAYCE